MGRAIRDWKPDRVEDSPVAPHRYLWGGAILPNGEPAKDLYLCDTYKERIENLVYVEGDVVYLDRGGKAVKARIYMAMTTARDRFGDRRECYKVQVETTTGQWSKLWEYAHPGFIQRGYQRAGLAPDVDAGSGALK